jgi:16S rRNA (guanine527-N7)-methyltransferase
VSFPGPAGSLAVPSAAATVFGARSNGVELAARYAEILASRGIDHGLIGPRERDRIWERHLLNCAVLAELFPAGTRVVDVGSGAGLPGIALACTDAGLRVTLVEPLERRVRFLRATVDELDLTDQVRIVPGRADSPAVRREAGLSPLVTARAVAPLDRLVRWCLPLLEPGGRLLAMKGRSAQAEIDEHREALADLGVRAVELATCGSAVLEEPVRVVVVTRGPNERTSG